MPKNVYDIIRFDGGLNTNTDKRNVGNNNLTGATNVEIVRNMSIDTKGKIKVAKGFDDTVLNASGEEVQISFDAPLMEKLEEQILQNKGKGLFIISHDYECIKAYDSGDNQFHNDPSYIRGGVMLLFYMEGAWLRILDVYSNTILDKTFNMIDIGSPSYDDWEIDENTPDSLIDPVFSVHNGEVIIANGNHDIRSRSLAVRLINRLYLENTDSEHFVRKWLVRPAMLETVTDLAARNLDVAGYLYYTPLSLSTQIAAPHEVGISFTELVSADENPAEGSLDGVWTFGLSYVMVDGSITDVEYRTSLGEYDAFGNLEYDQLEIGLTSNDWEIDCNFAYIPETQEWDFSIRGFVVWMKKEADSEWNALLKVDIPEGRWDIYADVPPGASNTGTLYSEDGVNWKVGSFFAAGDFIKPSIRFGSVFNFRELTSRYPEDANATYKTACSMNGYLYVGNIRQGGVVYGDRVLRSIHDIPTVLPRSNYIDAALHDGDEIVLLIGYADRLLQFKRRKLYIINCTKTTEYIEGEYENYGIRFKSAACKTPMGIAWANRFSAYLYTGQKVLDLISPKGVSMLSVEDWREFTFQEAVDGESEYERHIVAGYDPIENKVLMYNDKGNGYTFNLNDGSIVSSSGLIVNSESMSSVGFSNIVNYGKKTYMLTFAGTDPGNDGGGFFKYNADILPRTGIEIKTKDIDFQTPGVRKKVHAVWITYKCSGSSSGDTNLQVTYATNSSENFSGTFENNTGVFTAVDSTTNKIVLGGTGGSWHKERLIPSVSLNNIYSFQLKIAHNDVAQYNGEVPADFEIDDISIVFKQKGVR